MCYLRWKYGCFSQRFGCAIKVWQWSLSKSPSGHSRWKMFAIRGAKSQDDRWLSRRGSCAVCGHLWCQILHWDMRCPRVLGWSGVKYVQVSVSVERNSSIHQRIIWIKDSHDSHVWFLASGKGQKLKREDWVVKTLLHRLVVVIFSCLFFIGLFDSYRTWISFGESLQWLVTALPLTMRHESATICFIPIERMAIHLQKSRRVSHWTTCSIQIIPTVQLTIPSCTYCHSSKWLHDPYLRFLFALPCQSHGQEIAKLCLQPWGMWPSEQVASSSTLKLLNHLLDRYIIEEGMSMKIRSLGAFYLESCHFPF